MPPLPQKRGGIELQPSIFDLVVDDFFRCRLFNGLRSA